MPNRAASFEIDCSARLDARGEPVGPLPAFAEDPEALRSLYRAMVRARTFDAKAIALQRTGRLGTYASCLGQEAIGVGAASATSCWMSNASSSPKQKSSGAWSTPKLRSTISRRLPKDSSSRSPLVADGSKALATSAARLRRAPTA